MNDWLFHQGSDVSQLGGEDRNVTYDEEFFEDQPFDVTGDSKPYFYEGGWCLNVMDSCGQARVLHGHVKLATRRRDRFVLEFRSEANTTGKSWDKKFYLCEYCQRSGALTWIYYRNYVAQHIPRHHPDQCQQCENCDRAVYAPLMVSHAKLCSRSAGRAKKRRKDAPNFAALEVPRATDRTRLKDYITGLVASAKSVADEFESVLLKQGISVARGGSRDCIGYPLPNPGQQQPLCTELTTETSSEGTDTTSWSESKEVPLASNDMETMASCEDTFFKTQGGSEPLYECNTLYCQPPPSMECFSLR